MTEAIINFGLLAQVTRSSGERPLIYVLSALLAAASQNCCSNRLIQSLIEPVCASSLLR